MKFSISKIVKNAILFAIGFSVYITMEVIFRGYSFPIMGLCGGVAIVVLDKINDRISWDIDLFIQGLIGSAFITIMEYIIGCLSLAGYLPMMWDYSHLPLNYKGIVCVPFSLLWIVLSIIAILMADAYNYYVLNETRLPYYRIFGLIKFSFKERTFEKEL